jgi:hypothetical protein
MITNEMKPAMQGVIPSTIVTCSKDGIPNTTTISQAFYVDDNHIALSFQFFSKTIKNVRENPFASLTIFHPQTFENWVMKIEYIRSETEGDLFDQMDMQLEAIASMTGMTGIFQLKAADVYKIHAIEKNRSIALK